MEHITSTANRWVKLAAQLKIKKYREKNRKFLLEGLRSTEDAFRQGRRDAVCLLSKDMCDEPRAAAMIAEARDLHWLFLTVSDEIMKKISGTEHGQGILAILPYEPADIETLMKPLNGHYVVLDGVQDPGNLGTILRTAAAAGCRGVLLTEGTADPYAEKTVRSSMGSVLRLPVYEHVTASALRRIRSASGIPFVATALEDSMPYTECGPLPDAFFIFGNEGNGISKDVLALSDRRLIIPMAGSVESLNVSASAAIILFRFFEGETK